jgi:hypothetical protein
MDDKSRRPDITSLRIENLLVYWFAFVISVPLTLAVAFVLVYTEEAITFYTDSTNPGIARLKGVSGLVR